VERVYTNHRAGERRIHIEIDETEVRALATGDDTATKQLREICTKAAQRWLPEAGNDA
jgi:hypothetical protein